MRAVRYHECGGVETLVVEKVAEPLPGAGEIRVRVAVAGVDAVDWQVRSGAVRDVLPVELPAIPGRDAVGVVDATGAGVRGVHLANAENDPALLAKAGELGRQGRYTPRIERASPLERIADAHAHAARGHTRGKLVVRV